MPNALPSRLIDELNSSEVAKRLSEKSILCLPIGSIEQHGPHLPLNTDVVLAEEYTRRIIARWGEPLNLWQLPTQTTSLAREHEWASGTVSLSVDEMIAAMRDVARDIARSPARNLAIVNGHGGNRGILEALIQDFRADFGLNVCVMHPTNWAEADANAAIPDIHGGKNETAMMLAAAPHLVRRDQIAKLKNPPDAKAIHNTILDRGVSWPWTSDDKRLADMGVIGDAQAATAEFGLKLFDAVVEKAGLVLNQLLDRQRLLHD